MAESEQKSGEQCSALVTYGSSCIGPEENERQPDEEDVGKAFFHGAFADSVMGRFCLA
jgi:hypothetical protein